MRCQRTESRSCCDRGRSGRRARRRRSRRSLTTRPQSSSRAAAPRPVILARSCTRPVILARSCTRPVILARSCTRPIILARSCTRPVILARSCTRPVILARSCTPPRHPRAQRGDLLLRSRVCTRITIGPTLNKMNCERRERRGTNEVARQIVAVGRARSSWVQPLGTLLVASRVAAQESVRPGLSRAETRIAAEPIRVHSRRFASFAFSNRSNSTGRSEPNRTRTQFAIFRVFAVRFVSTWNERDACGG